MKIDGQNCRWPTDSGVYHLCGVILQPDKSKEEYIRSLLAIIAKQVRSPVAILKLNDEALAGPRMISWESPTQEGSVPTISKWGRRSIDDLHGNSWGNVYFGYSESEPEWSAEMDGVLKLLHKEIESSFGELCKKESGRLLQNAQAIQTLHEVGNVVTVIMGHLGLLERDLGNQTKSNHLDRVARGIEQIYRIIQEAKTQSREPSRARPSTDKIYISELMIQIKELYFASRAEVIVEAAPKDLVIDTNRTAITQILVNLLGNAVDAVANRPEPKVIIRAVEREQRVELQVIDNGPGIPAAIVGVIFEEKCTSKPVGKGTGLGLMITRDLVRKLGGRIWFESKDTGTAFFVSIPKQSNKFTN